MRGEEEEERGETGRSIEEKNHQGEKLGIDQGSKGQKQPGSGGEEMKVVMTGRSRAPGSSLPLVCYSWDQLCSLHYPSTQIVIRTLCSRPHLSLSTKEVLLACLSYNICVSYH